jgi:spermidine synthase
MKVVDKTKPIYYEDYHEMQVHPFMEEDVNETNNCVLIGGGNGRI